MTSVLDRFTDDPAGGGATGTGTPPARTRPARREPLPPATRRRRRRLVLASLPVVVLLLLASVRLVSLNLVHERTLQGYTAGDAETALTWAQRQGWVNVVEPFRAPFAVGDAHVLSGQFEQARPFFEEAFALVPKGGVEECRVRVNLGLTYEALGDAANAGERPDEARQLYDKGLAVVRDRPPLCDAPEGGDTGERLDETQQRLEEKAQGAPQPDSQEPAPAPPAPQPSPTPTPDPSRTPSQDEQDYLREQQRQNTIERNQQQGQDDRVQPDGSPAPTYPKPW